MILMWIFKVEHYNTIYKGMELTLDKFYTVFEGFLVPKLGL